MKEVVKLLRPTEDGDITGAVIVLRPSTPEEQKKKCLNCSGMEDFISSLQQEIKRLQVRSYLPKHLIEPD